MSNNLIRKQAVKIGKMVKLPKDWTVKQIKEIMDLESGVWDKEDKNGYPVLRSTNFTESGYIDFKEVTYRDIPDRKIDDKKLKKGDVLLEISGGGPKQPVGRVVLFNEKKNESYLFGNFVKRLRLKNKLLGKNDPFYIFRFLERYYDIGQTETLQHQTTGIRNLDYKAYMSLPLPLPPFSEQKKIASILSSVDESIEKTDEVIEETKELKKGLMQELLTKGIGHSDFKEVRLNTKKVSIPLKWEVRKLEELVKIKNGYSPSKFDFFEDGKYPFIKVNDMNFAYKYISKANLYFNKSKYDLAQPKTIIFPKRGASISTNKINILSKKAYYDTNVMGLITNDKLVNEYLYYYIQNLGLWQFADTTSIPQINNKHIYPLLVPYPPLEEQKKIASILSSVDNKIQKEEEYKSKLEKLKKGLMQKLLTGEIRVNTDMEV